MTGRGFKHIQNQFSNLKSHDNSFASIIMSKRKATRNTMSCCACDDNGRIIFFYFISVRYYLHCMMS